MAGKAWVHSLRIPNLALVLLVFIIPAIKYRTQVNPEVWWPALFCALFGALFAYLVNDLYDVAADEINRPGTNLFSLPSHKTYALVLMGISAMISMVSLALLPTPIDWLCLLALTGAWLYAAFWQRVPWIGMTWVSLSVAFLMGLALYSSSEKSLHNLFFFPFLAGSANFLREWAKDLHDLPGDKVHKIGKPMTKLSRTQAILGFRGSAILFTCIWLLSCPSSPENIPIARILTSGFLTSMTAVAIFCIRKSPGFTANWLKFGFFLGILSILLF